jgi:hypothetical protein
MGKYKMISLSSIIQSFEHDFLTQYQHSILPSHRKALAVMKDCRSPRSLMMKTQCDDCNHTSFTPHSCGHRNCPHCQHHESQQWLERQLKKQVPAEYFMITFTIPFEFRSLAWSHQRLFYSIMMRCSWETLHTFSRNDKLLQGDPGATAVLHTHSRKLEFHPHIHFVMPGAAIDQKHKLWRKKEGYLFKHKALAKVFRAKLLSAIQKEGLTLPPKYPFKWVVDVKSVGSGQKALTYLGKYLYKGVIQEKDIISSKDGLVTFRYINSKNKKTEYRTVSGAKFLWLFLQHVLPKGFRRARNFGFLHPNSKRMITLIQLLLNFNPNVAINLLKKRPPISCKCCGGIMSIIKTRIKSIFGSLPDNKGVTLVM